MPQQAPSVVRTLFAALFLALAARAPADAQQSTEPPVSAVLDSAQLVLALGAMEAPAADEKGQPVFVIHFAPSGAVDSVRPRFPRHAPANAAALAALVATHVRPQPARQKGWSYGVRAVAGPGPRVESPKFRERRPQLLNVAVVSREVERSAERLRSASPGYWRGVHSVVVRGIVDEDGRLTSVEVERGSRDSGLDREALRIARLARYHPGTLDDVAIPVLVRFPVTFSF